MAGIDDIISGVGGNTRADFSGVFSGGVDAYNAARDQKAKNELRDVFKGGVPTLPDGSVDYGSMAKSLYQKGAIGQGNELIGASIGPSERAKLYELDQPQASLKSPPSTSSQRLETVASPLNKGGAVPQGGQPRSGDQPGSIVGLISAAGIPDELAGPYIGQLSAMTKSDPNAALNPEMSQRVQQVIQAAAQRMKGGQQPQPTGMTPQPVPQPQPQMAQAPQPAPQQGFQPSPAQQAAQNDPILKRLTVLSASPDKNTAAAAKVRLEAYLKDRELTADQKNAAAAGQSVADYQSKGAEAAAQLAIMKENILPEMKDSLKSAKAAKDEIQAIHRSREQLDTAGGIFSGAGSEVKLKVAKFAELLGVPNADRIANTEAYGAAIGGRVLALVKGLGVNPSNSDRVFAEKMAGGNIALDETSIRRILDIGEKAARSKIDSHNADSEKYIKSNEALQGYRDVNRVEAPGQYERPKGSKASPVKSSPSTFGSPADVHAAIAAGQLKKGDSFVDPNGKTRYVP